MAVETGTDITRGKFDRVEWPRPKFNNNSLQRHNCYIFMKLGLRLSRQEKALGSNFAVFMK